MSSGKVDRQLIDLLTRPLATKVLQLGLLLAGCLLAWKNLHVDLGFDDAFMFYLLLSSST